MYIKFDKLILFKIPVIYLYLKKESLKIRKKIIQSTIKIGQNMKKKIQIEMIDKI